MSKLTDLEQRILMKIKPKHEEYELLQTTFGEISSVINTVLRQYGVEAEVTLQGSVAHDTWLSGDRDLDVFVLFPSDWTRDDLEKKGFPILLEAAKKIGSYELRYAEHPYVRVKIGDVEADIVPGLKLLDPSKAKTAVDRTPFHTKYVNSKLTDELRDHVRLLKKYMKAINVYGAEVKTRGFSGYAVELLIIVYGGFREVLSEVSRWKPPVFVNTLGENITRDFIREFRKKYPDSCIYMPDPVDPMRNVTASVSLRSLSSFIIASRCYLKNPDTLFFEEETELNASSLYKSIIDRCIIIIAYNLREALPPDVVWGEALRVSSTLARILGQFDVEVIDYSAWTNEKSLVVVAVELDKCELSTYKHYKGPCIIHDEDRVHNFVRKHAGKGFGPWITDDGCLNSLDRRVVLDVATLIESRWLEYTVSPHLKTVKPIVTRLNTNDIEWLIAQGAGRWIKNFVLKTPPWMEKCIS
ncbi:MAG: CCA tRNA nucleotidyltransferase [Desulfurococcaceae archaeon]